MPSDSIKLVKNYMIYFLKQVKINNLKKSHDNDF